MNSFSDMGLPENIADALASFGFDSPTPVQRESVPRILARKDLFMQSETGTGKTLAYLAPAFALARDMDFGKGPGIIVLSPTQELAVQVAGQAEKLASAAGLRWNVVTILGGSPLSRQETELRRRAAVVVGTPGRLADLLKMGALKTRNLAVLVMDEADRLFVPESADSVRAIAGTLPEPCVRVLASATLDAKTRRIAAPFLRSPEATASASEGILSEKIEHWVFYVDHRKRTDFIRRFDSALKPARCLVFASRSDRVEWTVERLLDFGLPADSVLSRQDKEHRRVALERFAQGKIRYLVTSDLGARGLDIAGISHILSMDLPEESSVYVHRAGRTGRAGASGISVVMADGVELKRASRIAVGGNFVFRCKYLESGTVYEPPVDEFFARVEAAEAEKRAHKRERGNEHGNEHGNERGNEYRSGRGN
ncbi:MAG: DEAD/DEAH box helicase [Rectinemataceae bacterium]